MRVWSWATLFGFVDFGDALYRNLIFVREGILENFAIDEFYLCVGDDDCLLDLLMDFGVGIQVWEAALGRLGRRGSGHFWW